MAAVRQLRELIDRIHGPRVSVRKLERDGGLKTGQLGWRLKDSAEVRKMPEAHEIADLARAIGCEPVEVARAFAAHLGIPYTEYEFSDEDLAILRAARRLPPAHKAAMRVAIEQLADSLEHGH